MSDVAKVFSQPAALSTDAVTTSRALIVGGRPANDPLLEVGGEWRANDIEGMDPFGLEENHASSVGIVDDGATRDVRRLDLGDIDFVA